MAVAQRNIPATGILQEWVAKLGLRHQGVLLTAVRGCDTSPKHDDSKDLTRAFRGTILNTHCANPEDAKSFIEYCTTDELIRRCDRVVSNHDHLPHHFLMHLVHAAEVVAYYHPSKAVRAVWFGFYISMCNKFHMGFEEKAVLDKRLNADEETFAELQ